MTEALHPDRRVLNALLAAKDDIARVVLLIQSLQRNGHAYAVEVCSHHLCGCIVPIATGIQIRDGSNQQLQLYIIRRLAGICQGMLEPR